MRKKATKSKEQTLAENYFPVDERDVKYAIEKENKPMNVDIVTISKPEKAKRVARTFKSKKKTYTKKNCKKIC